MSDRQRSFKRAGRRCDACGRRQVRVEMQFLADVFVPCDVATAPASGRRCWRDLCGKKATRSWTSPCGRRCSLPRLAQGAAALQVLDEIGLGTCARQPATTLSGGERSVSDRRTPLDPGRRADALHPRRATTGLPSDIAKLLAAFRKLLAAGHSLLVIEHNLDVIKTADWVVDLGPEGGYAGGEVVAVGSPEAIAAVEASHTGRHLRVVLEGASLRS